MKLTNDILEFINIHKTQLQLSGVPEHFWKTLYTKIKNSDYNLESNFALCKVDYDEERKSEDPIYVLQVINEDGIKKDDLKQIYLIDHAWTFRIENIRPNLREIDGLLVRMCNLMDVDNSLSIDERIEKVCERMWKYCQSYTISNAVTVEDRLPVWYIMDEVGCAMVHNIDPNFRAVPFVVLPDKITYTIMFPIKDVEYGAFVSRDCVEGVNDEDIKKCLLLPWETNSEVNGYDYKLTEPSLEYFLSGHIEETLPDITDKPITKTIPLKVYSEYDMIRKNLNREDFKIVDNESEADILWYTSHFKDYANLSIEKFVNQFPFENVLTIKDLLAIISRRKSPDGGYPVWFPITFNLKTELPQFVSYYKHIEKEKRDNIWICKPFNLARGLDTHITSNLNYILRLASVGPPKIAQKYIENPVLFHRDEIGGKVKFDVRYVILLKSVQPLKVYVYKNFFLRFSNKPFSLTDFHDYEKHFTVMNYTEGAELKKMLSEEFIQKWNEQYEDHPWVSVESKILKALKEVFEAATEKPSPKGIAPSPRSRALYAADLMLNWDGTKDTIEPKLLEINWTPDCQRACDYYPDFYDKIFGLLFLNEDHDVFKEL